MGGAMMNRIFTALAVASAFFFFSQPALAKCPDSAQTLANPDYLLLPTPCERDIALKAAKGVNFLVDGANGNSFIAKDKSHWQATVTSGGQKTTIVVYKQLSDKEVRNVENIRRDIGKGNGKITATETTRKGIVNVAFTTKRAKMGNFLKFANKGDFAKIEIQNATTIIVSPKSPLSAKDGAVEVASLPKPIADALSAAGLKSSVKLPTGIFTASQFKPGSSDFIDEVFHETGLTNPVTSFISLNAGNYANLLKGKAGISLSVMLTQNNGISRLIELTQMMKTPRSGRPVITIGVGGGVGGIGKVNIAYKAPYLVMGKGPIKTALKFSYNLKKKKISGELSVGIGAIKNPVIVPGLIELDGVSFKDTEITIGFEPGEKGIEVTGGLEIGTMQIKKKAFSPVKFQLAMTAAGPSGGLIEIKSDDTLYLGDMADLAEVAFNAHPASKLVPNWARKDMSKNLQLHKLPEFGIRKPHIFLATPGQDDSSHLADFADIAGAGIRVKGQLEAMGQRLTYTDLGLDVVNGLNVLSYVRPFKAGVFELKGAELAIHASFKATPYFKLHAGMEIQNLSIGEADLEFGRKRMKVAVDNGCFYPYLKYKIDVKDWTDVKSKSIDASDCAKQFGVVVANAGKAAGKWSSKAVSDSGKWSAKAGSDAAKWSAKAAADTAKFFKDAGCSIEDAFSGGNCSKKKNKAKRRKARKKAGNAAHNYRKIAGPGHCTAGWVWNHKARKCWRTGYEMFFFTQDKGKTGRCMDIKSRKNKNGQPVILWDCHASWNQQFRIVPFDSKAKNSVLVRLRTTGDKCVSVDTRKKVARGTSAIIWKCDSNPGQSWRLAAGKLISANGLCLRPSKGNTKGSSLVMTDCEMNSTVANFEKEIARLNGQKKKLFENPPMRKIKRKLPTGFGQKKVVVAKVIDGKKLRKMTSLIDKQITENSKKLAAERKNPADKKSQKIDWVTVKPSPNPADNFHKKYKVPSMAMLKVSAGNFCLDKTGSMLPRARPHLWKCNRKNGNQKIGIGAVSGDYFALVSGRSKMCMDVKGANTRHGASVFQYPCHYGSNQQWLAVSPGDKATDAKTFAGKFQIKNRKSGKCLAPTIFKQTVTYTAAQKQHLKRMSPAGRKHCERSNGLSNVFIQCPRGRSRHEIVSQTRKKARFAQVNCKASDKNQLFTLLR